MADFNQMYVRYTQLGGRAILWLVAIFSAALAVHYFLAVGPWTPGAVLLSALFLIHFAAARAIKRSQSRAWVELGRPSFVPSPERGGLSRLMWFGGHRELGIRSVSLLAVCFNIATIALLYWLIALCVRFAR